MSGPLIVGIAGGDDLRDGAVGMAAQIDSFHAQDVVAAASAAGNAGIMIEEIEQPFVVERRARHADRGMHAQGERAALSILAIGADHRGREPMSFIKRGRSCRGIGLRAEANTVQAVGVFEAGQVAE